MLARPTCRDTPAEPDYRDKCEEGGGSPDSAERNTFVLLQPRPQPPDHSSRSMPADDLQLPVHSTASSSTMSRPPVTASSPTTHSGPVAWRHTLHLSYNPETDKLQAEGQVPESWDQILKKRFGELSDGTLEAVKENAQYKSNNPAAVLADMKSSNVIRDDTVLKEGRLEVSTAWRLSPRVVHGLASGAQTLPLPHNSRGPSPQRSFGGRFSPPPLGPITMVTATPPPGTLERLQAAYALRLSGGL
ncbi:hypothetical protein PAPYR_8201 [Paratrimastix pyriformis]|uniref:Uncharacterized protein n=1 Tax=Paratrimastix pyriformis TaxID=342808 RepID=A0ABQ8UB85_9EUKA|nr:hypothetical protein PAPYR_8201 [Paratrimastix pyriformis]